MGKSRDVDFVRAAVRFPPVFAWEPSHVGPILWCWLFISVHLGSPLWCSTPTQVKNHRNQNPRIVFRDLRAGTPCKHIQILLLSASENQSGGLDLCPREQLDVPTNGDFGIGISRIRNANRYRNRIRSLGVALHVGNLIESTNRKQRLCQGVVPHDKLCWLQWCHKPIARGLRWRIWKPFCSICLHYFMFRDFR